MTEEEDKLKAEAEAKAKSEAEEKAKLEAEAKSKEEAEAKLKEESEIKAKEEADAKAKEEAKAKVEEEKEDLTTKKLDEMKTMMENILKDVQKKDPGRETSTKTEQKEDKGVEKKDIEPSGNKVEVDLLKGQYIFQVPEDWTESDKAKFNVIVTETMNQKRPLILDSSIKVFEVKEQEKKE